MKTPPSAYKGAISPTLGNTGVAYTFSVSISCFRRSVYCPAVLADELPCFRTSVCFIFAGVLGRVGSTRTRGNVFVSQDRVPRVYESVRISSRDPSSSSSQRSRGSPLKRVVYRRHSPLAPVRPAVVKSASDWCATTIRAGGRGDHASGRERKQ